MDPFKELADALTEAYQKCNQALTGLPPMEQVEAASEMGWAFRNARQAVTCCEQTVANFQSKLAALKSAVEAKMEAAASAKAEELAPTKAEELLAAKLQSGDYVKKDDVTAQVELARTSGEQAATLRFETIRNRREELAKTDSGVQPEVVAMLTDEAVLDDGYKQTALCAQKRVTELVEIGVKVPTVLCEAARLPVGDDGDAAHLAKLNIFKEVRQPGSSSLAGLDRPTGEQVTTPVMAM